jgi:hypothetical protein
VLACFPGSKAASPDYHVATGQATFAQSIKCVEIVIFTFLELSNSFGRLPMFFLVFGLNASLSILPPE